MPIDDLTVVQGRGAPAPDGYFKLPSDLNGGAGGEYLYFAYRRGHEAPLTDVRVVYGSKPDVALPVSPSGQPYTRIDVDLNKGAGGKYIYACTTRDPMAGGPILRMKVISGDDSGIQPRAPFQRVDVDLNLGAGGDYVYLCYSRYLLPGESELESEAHLSGSFLGLGQLSYTSPSLMTLKFDGDDFSVTDMEELVFTREVNTATIGLSSGSGSLRFGQMQMDLSLWVDNTNLALKSLQSFTAQLSGVVNADGAVSLLGTGVMESPTVPCELTVSGMLQPPP